VLTGTYGGASGSIAAGVGVGANVLLGGSAQSVMLQPISVEGSVGVEVTLGVAALTLSMGAVIALVVRAARSGVFITKTIK
jgi:hypothetical protein